MTTATSTAEQKPSRSRPRRLDRTATCETAFCRVGLRCLGEVAANHAATCTGDPTALHQTRVALTRLRAAVAFYTPMVGDAEWSRLKAELKWLNSYLGAARDLDVAIETLTQTGLGGVRALKAERRASQERLKQALESDRYRRWFDGMTDWIERGPWTAQQDPRASRRRALAAGTYHARKLARWHDKLTRKSRGLQGMGKRKLHRLRLAGKRLRYAIEFSDGVFPKDEFSRWRDIVKQLRKGQKILGELNDAEIRQSLIAGLARSNGSASVPDEKQMKEFDRKRARRLLRRAAVVYRKIAG
jgi:CHAD domain-containing protein